MDGPRITDSDGNDLEVRMIFYTIQEIGQDGVVRGRHQDRNGNITEWETPLWRSPLRGVFADWIWDVLDDQIDPRNE